MHNYMNTCKRVCSLKHENHQSRDVKKTYWTLEKKKKKQ